MEEYPWHINSQIQAVVLSCRDSLLLQRGHVSEDEKKSGELPPPFACLSPSLPSPPACLLARARVESVGRSGWGWREQRLEEGILFPTDRSLFRVQKSREGGNEVKEGGRAAIIRPNVR